MQTQNRRPSLKSLLGTLSSILFLALISSSCTYNQYSTVKEYQQYLNVKANGLVITRNFEHLELVVKNIPTGMRVLQDIDKGANDMTISAMFKEYSQSILFIVSLAPSQHCPVRDLNYYGVSSDEEYKERQKALDFDMAQYFNLTNGEKSLSPQICHYEHDYGVSGKLTLLLVFAAENGSDIDLIDGSKDIKLIFNDPFFDTKISEFNFSSSTLQAVPKL